MTAEWCDTDPVQGNVQIGGKRHSLHVIVSVPVDSRQLAHQTEIVSAEDTSTGAIVVVNGPPCRFRLRAYTRPRGYEGESDSTSEPGATVRLVLN